MILTVGLCIVTIAGEAAGPMAQRALSIQTELRDNLARGAYIMTSDIYDANNDNSGGIYL